MKATPDKKIGGPGSSDAKRYVIVCGIGEQRSLNGDVLDQRVIARQR
jgi:hypothetical protein